MARWELCIRLTIVLVLCVVGMAKRQKSMQVVDMTHEHGSDTLFWPGDPEFSFNIVFRGEIAPGEWFELNSFTTADHGGTHLDAPAHYSKGGWRTHQVPIDNLIGPGVIIDVREKASADPDYRVTIQDLIEWEDEYGRIPEGAVVIMNSDWDKYYPNAELTFGTATPNDSATFHFPGFHEDAADWLARYRDINVLGVDTPSTDYGQSANFLVHQTIAKAGICGLENVAYVNRLPPKGSTIFVGVIKLFDGSGGPARTIAVFSPDD